MGIVRRAQGATTKAIPVWIVEEEQRRDRPQDPCALRVAAAGAVCFVASARRCAPTSPAPPRLASGPPALATRPFVLSPRTANRGHARVLGRGGRARLGTAHGRSP